MPIAFALEAVDCNSRQLIVNSNTTVNINVLSNDSDPDGNPLKLSIFKPANYGKVAVNNNSTPDYFKDDFITYTPDSNFSGDDIFLYQIEDGRGGSDVTKVEMTVKAIIPSILNGTPDADTLTGTDSNDINDFAIDLKGDEPLSSNADGNDIITLLGTYANSLVDMGGGDDTFQGGLGADSVTGGDGNDTLIGGGGSDQLAGNAGDDLLTGGAGNDMFLFRSNSAFNAADFGSDRITDFAIGSDKILLSQTSFGTITSANIAFLNSDLAAETSDGLIVYSRATGKLFFNQNGAAVGLGTGALFATLDGAPSLTASDFQIVM